ncbi:hypothetical protein UA38_12000 [Photobacterium kishitanii]|uniref:NlpE C-terminal OB domain-containing protein n=1 Tax=Photobacterium kishitanii TaxID=318456 RepID=A0AAX0YQV6_9GAMM|nr:hypothetical protein [Photobacterium kishitanii]KJG57088.1 hypothetical protein UA38_12000 [Photobacterium kishitanii]KJG60615.1 hypothetical protein UA42_14800 [Photobacterium kishitanii]KJG64917.1 hypothetical protein UA40_14495 [Photobacterium kishitanii]KJG66160.1 hypothetical protein UA41_21170 [Photobacterium kishitanii]PSX18292.1 hypothetical protein C0W70_15585 [Photobacterium kishitanii]
MKLLHFWMITLSTLAGCSSPTEERFEGYFTYGHEVSDFRKCNTNTKIFWLNGDSSQMQIIEKESLQLAQEFNEPYKDIYVIFSGFIEQREPVGFEEETDGLLYMTKLLKYSKVRPISCY